MVTETGRNAQATPTPAEAPFDLQASLAAYRNSTLPDVAHTLFLPGALSNELGTKAKLEGATADEIVAVVVIDWLNETPKD